MQKSPPDVQIYQVNNEAPQLNTKILYCYTSQSNYKAHGSIIVEGVFTDNQLLDIMDCLFDSDSFICRQVGFPEVSSQFVDYDNFPHEDDHCWTRFEFPDLDDIADFKDNFELIEEEPTTPMTANHVFLNFLRAKHIGWKDADTYDLMINHNFTIHYGTLFSMNTHILPGDTRNLWKHEQLYSIPNLTHFFLTIQWHQIHTLLGTLLNW